MSLAPGLDFSPGWRVPLFDRGSGFLIMFPVRGQVRCPAVVPGAPGSTLRLGSFHGRRYGVMQVRPVLAGP
jgi:hypothetical protein